VYAQGQPYPQAAGYGPPQVDKPGAITGAAVLGFIQAGLTLITTGLIFAGLAGAGSDGGAEGWLIALAQLAGLVMLIFGAVQLLSGSSRTLFVVATGLELVLCLYWFIRIVAVDSAGLSIVQDAKAIAAVGPLFFAVLPLIGLILALGSGPTRYIQAKRGR
jgi:uncharacterized membrane protein